MEDILDTYVRTVCIHCKNKNTDLCDVRRNIERKLQCTFYEKKVEQNTIK